CRPLGEREIGVVAGTSEAVVVFIEAAVQPDAALERHGPDEGARCESLPLQDCRDRGETSLQTVSAVIANAMLARIRAGQDAGVWGACQAGVRVREVETRAGGGERIEIRRLRRAAVAGKGVRAQGVDGDEEKVLVGAALE